MAGEVEDGVAAISFAQEYHPEVLGEYAERQAASTRLLWLAIIAAVVIFFLLVTAFRSTRLAVISFITLPSALVGGVLAAWLGDGVLSSGIAGRLPRGARHRGPQRHHADQPLPAPGKPGRR